MQNNCLINGRTDLHLSPLDRGFAYGDGVFRTLVVRHGVPQCWRRQYQKLAEDCAELGLECPESDLLLAEIQRLCGQDMVAGIKVVITRGEGLRGYALPVPASPTRVVLKFALPDYPAHHYTEGVRLHLCHLRLSLQPRLAGIKHLNRLENVLARMEWDDAAIADGLLLDADGHVIEGTMCNLFMRNGNSLLTPHLGRCGVAGVTRQRIIELAPRLGYTVSVADIHLEELQQAEEVIVCNSLFGVWQVRALQQNSWPAGSLASQLGKALLEENAFID